MNRQIITRKDLALEALNATSSLYATPDGTAPKKTEEKTPDDYMQRLAKYIPSEVIALYTTLNAIIVASDMWNGLLWIAFVFCLFGTYLYLIKKAGVKKQMQLIISLGSFVVWVFAIGGPFATLAWYHSNYGALLMPAYTFLVSIYEP